jgi:RNA polymerase sigma factor (sigma-70 family)
MRRGAPSFRSNGDHWLVVQSDFYAELDPSTLQRAQRGDRAAFEAIYRQYRRASYTLALRVLGEPAAAEDVVQEVFVRLFDAIKRFRGAAPFGAWLRRMVANATVDELRRRRWLDDSIEPETFASSAQIAGLPEQQAEAWNLLQRVPPVARAVLVLHEVEGYTHKEMAQMFGQSESYSKSILARALHRLSALTAPSAENPTESRHVRTRRA